jgi:uncharacterized protein
MKKIKIFGILFTFALVVIGGLLTGCASSRQAKFYNLTALPPSQNARALKLGTVIVVDSVSLPGYLDKPQIVTFQPDGFELDVSEYNRWIEPLSDSMQRVLAEDLLLSLKNTQVMPMTSYSQNYDYRVVADIAKLQATFNERIVMEVWWTIYNKKGQMLYTWRNNLHQPLGDSYEQIASGYSRLLRQTADIIAERFGKLYSKQ